MNQLFLILLCHDAGITNRIIRQTPDRTRIDLSRLYCTKRKYNGSADACRQSGVGFNMVMVLRAVNHDLAGKIGNKEFVTRALNDYKKRILSASSAPEINAVRANLAGVDRKIRNLTDAVADGFDRSVAINQLNALKMQRDDLNTRLLQLELPVKQSADVPTVADVQLIYREFLAIGDRLDDALMIKIHAAFIDRILLHPDRIDVQYKYFTPVSIPIPPGTILARKIDVPRLLREFATRRTMDIAAEMCVTPNALRYHLKKNGIKPRKNVKIDAAELKKMRKTHTVDQIAKRFKVHPRTVFNHLAKL